MRYENMKMKVHRIILTFAICHLSFFTCQLSFGQTAQQKARQQERAQEGPVLFDYDSTYLANQQAEREELLVKKALIDSLDISRSLREKLIRDLYKAKPTKRLTKALLAATITEEEDLTGDPESPNDQ